MSLDGPACGVSATRTTLPVDAQVIHTVFGVDGTLIEDQHADQLAAAMSHLELEVSVDCLTVHVTPYGNPNDQMPPTSLFISGR